MSKKALITGISGQDGSYLAKLLDDKGYTIHGITRGIHSNLYRLEFLGIKNKVKFHECDLANKEEVNSLLEEIEVDEVYNLAAQSSVGYSFSIPQKTFEFNTKSVTNLLEGIRSVRPKTRFYQASSSEMFGNVSMQSLPIKESLLFHPVSPYGISKASAHWLAVNYREAYNLYTACGILFNHESCLRGENFVIKKIINTALRIKNGTVDELTLGNLAVKRDWGYAPKYVEAMWLSLQQENPDDYIVCSGNLSSLQEIVVKVFEQLDLDLYQYIRLDPMLMRSLDLSIIYGDNGKAKKQLSWDYNITTNELIRKLVEDEKSWINWKGTN